MSRARFIKVKDRTELYYEEWGNGQPIVFLHGAGSNWEQWNYNMLPLSRQLRCIAYDKRGHGCSSDFGRRYDYDVLADDLAEVIQQLDLHRVVLVAHSMGAGEAVRYLTRHGSDRVVSLVLVGPTLPFILKTHDNPDGIDKSALDNLRAEWSKDFPGWVAANARPFSPRTLQEQWSSGVVRC